MTSSVTNGVGDRVITIACDGDSCSQNHNNTEIANGGGLHQMGWTTRFDHEARKLLHFCPAHKEASNG